MCGSTTIRVARPEDRSILIEIMHRSSLAAETGEVLRRLVQQPNLFDVDEVLLEGGQVILAESDGVPVGFASFIVAGSDVAELDSMFVEQSYWRRGIGLLILKAVEHELVARQATGIRVVAGLSAVPFYEAAGFCIIGEEATQLGPVVPVMLKTIA